jgi:hypothetical protein
MAEITNLFDKLDEIAGLIFLIIVVGIPVLLSLYSFVGGIMYGVGLLIGYDLNIFTFTFKHI